MCKSRVHMGNLTCGFDGSENELSFFQFVISFVYFTVVIIMVIIISLLNLESHFTVYRN